MERGLIFLRMIALGQVIFAFGMSTAYFAEFVVAKINFQLLQCLEVYDFNLRFSSSETVRAAEEQTIA